jgi:coenzyme F420-0:L-glutamate ligase/coenzyme F420-1:gamma-L-glutamate ligase
MMPFGTMDLAVGSSGISPVSKMFGQKDLFGRPKFGGMDLVANELTSAAALLFGQTGAGVPVVIIRGCEYEPADTENIANTILPILTGTGAIKAIKAALRATAHSNSDYF